MLKQKKIEEIKKENSTKVENKIEKATINKNFMKYLTIFFGGIVVLIIIGIVVAKIRNRKLNKMLDKL